MFPGVSEKRLRDLYRKWGGSILWCLTNAHFSTNGEVLTKAIKYTNVPALREAITFGEMVYGVRCSRCQVKCWKQGIGMAGHLVGKPYAAAASSLFVSCYASVAPLLATNAGLS